MRVCVCAGFCVCFYVCVLGKGLGDGFWADKKLTNKPPHEVCVNLYISLFVFVSTVRLTVPYVCGILSLSRSLSLAFSFSLSRARSLSHIYAL